MIKIENIIFYTAKELANKFNVSMSSVARWRQNEWIKSFQINKRTHLYSEEQIMNFINRNNNDRNL